ncbi:MAG: hypothetical protein PHC66_03290 [Candidatus Nanoarchaeia archaeon]|nr:hypothetical protein [Candidatus Nanoarchaeia archaeon]MDD5239855.1 hypothetical protein [Candidatus Nanoarchaeia archaeon]
MGFFDWLIKPKKKEEETIVSREIATADLIKAINDIEEEKFSAFYKSFWEFNKQMEMLAKEIERKVSGLANARVSQDVDGRLLAKIHSAKENFIKKTNFVNSKLNKGFCFTTFGEIRQSLEQMEVLAKELNTSGAKYLGAIAIVYKRQADDIATSVKKVIELFKEVKTYFESNEKVDAFEKLKERAAKLVDLIDYRKKIEDETFSKENDKEILERQIDDLKKKISVYEGAESYKNVKPAETELQKQAEELNSEKVMLRNKFADFSKAAAKFLHDYPLSKEDERLLNMYLSEPYDAMDSDPEFEILGTLKEMKKAVEAEKFSLDERLTKKSAAALAEFISGDALKKSMDKKKEIIKRIVELRVELEKSGIFELNALNVKLKDDEKKHKDTTTALQVQEELLRKNMDGIGKLKSEVSDLFLKFSINAKIN